LENDIKAYINDPERSNQAEQPTRSQLATAVLANPQSAIEWWAFLFCEERAALKTLDAESNPSISSPKDKITLRNLYDWAVRLVPQQGNKSKPAFVNLWLGHARQEW